MEVLLEHVVTDAAEVNSPVRLQIELDPNGLTIQLGDSAEYLILDYAETLRVLHCNDDTDEQHRLIAFRVEEKKR